MQPNTRLNKYDYDKNLTPDFHCCYRGIVGSLGHLVTMTRPDLAWAYSELSKYVQIPGQNHILAAEHCEIFAARGIKQFATLVILKKNPTFCGVG